MNDSNIDKNLNSDPNKEKKYNLVQTIMNSQNLMNINKKQNDSSFLQIQQNINISKKNINQADLKTNSSKNNSNFLIMKEMKTKISNNDYTSIKELLKDSKLISQQSKNQLLSFSFSKYNAFNNKIQRKIILELINNGADPNHRLKFIDLNEKSKVNNSLTLPNLNIRINPLIFCCFKGDFDLYELLKNKLNLSTYNENNNIQVNKNYFFSFFENNLNLDNKYKIANDILTNMKKCFNINININEYDNTSGMTLLMVSIIKQYTNFIKLFLDNEADINLRNIKDGNTAIHYAALIKNKDIIELLLKYDDINLLIKNNENETCVDIANKNNNTEIYELLAERYTQQQKILEEKKSKELQNSNNENNIKIGLNNINRYKEYMRNNHLENDKMNDCEEGLDLIKNNQIKDEFESLNSYIEIPFNFNNYNYINKYDSNNANNIQNNNINLDKSENELNNINGDGLKNYLRFKTPILNINLKTEEDEELLILDNLKSENKKYDLEFEELEENLGKIYNEHNILLQELSKVNNDIKAFNNEIELYSKQIEDTKNKNLNELNNIQFHKKSEDKNLEILLSQENFINLKDCHEQLLKDEEYLNKKFSDDLFDENQIKKYLVKDILDFQNYNKVQIKKKQKPINNIRSSLQEKLENNNYDYNVYIFGSYATGLCLNWSDLDLILINKNHSLKNNDIVDKLKEIMNLLNNIDWVDKPNLIIDYYAFPFITFSTDEKHGFMKVNLTIQDNKNNGYKCVKLIQQFLKSYKNLEPLTLVIKQLMKCSNSLFYLSNYLNNSPETLNSYSIILMIIYFLQVQLMGCSLEKINNPDNLGELFINFLLYYMNFDCKEKNYIFVRTGLNDALESDEYLHLTNFNSKLIIIDPLEHKNNVSLKTSEFRNIQFILKLIYLSSKIKCECSCHYLKNSKINEDTDKKNNKNNDNNKFVELGTEHCILKKIFKTAYRINSNLLKVFN